MAVGVSGFKMGLDTFMRNLSTKEYCLQQLNGSFRYENTDCTIMNPVAGQQAARKTSCPLWASQGQWSIHCGKWGVRLDTPTWSDPTIHSLCFQAQTI